MKTQPTHPHNVEDVSRRELLKAGLATSTSGRCATCSIQSVLWST